MLDVKVESLAFINVNYGVRETPLNLYPLLYRGGASIDMRKVFTNIDSGKIGLPLLERLPLLLKLHEVIQGTLTGGGSRFTAKTNIQCLRYFYTWADNIGLSPELSSVEQLYFNWSEYLLNSNRINKKLKIGTIASMASCVALILDQALELTIGLYRNTRIPNYNKKKRILGSQAEKINLANSFTFGNALLDISDQLTVEKIRGPLPFTIRFRTGQSIEEWSRLKSKDKVKHLIEDYGREDTRRRVIEAREAWIQDSSWRTRYPVINLRIQAEMLIFIAQTGMNISQANKLELDKCSYQSYNDGYQVRRIYKGRRHGEVEFTIFSEYRIIFERYLKWRKIIFADDDNKLLFPLYSPQQRSSDKATNFSAIKLRFKKLGIPYINPSLLRKTRINWLVRKSHDPALTADMSQHTQETLFRNYYQPNHQDALIEISRFHSLTDPSFIPPGPGKCVEINPIAITNSPTDAPTPDCISPAGCIFCAHQRDIDSLDHIWSLVSYRHYKSMELTLYRVIENDAHSQPANLTVIHITKKIQAISDSSEHRAEWVTEALNRVKEGDFHPKWDGFIRLIEEIV